MFGWPGDGLGLLVGEKIGWDFLSFSGVTKDRVLSTDRGVCLSADSSLSASFQVNRNSEGVLEWRFALVCCI